MNSALKQSLLFVSAFGAVLAAGLEIRQSYGRPRTVYASPAVGMEVADWQEVQAGGVQRGPANAAYTLVLFSDYQCPACALFHQTLNRLVAAHPDSLRVITRHMPLSGIHPFARTAALAANCAHDQGRFGESELLLYGSQDSIGLVPWSLFAQRAGVSDLTAFESCLVDPEVERRLDVDEQLATRSGFSGTPTFVVAGRAYEGAWPDSAVLKLLRSSVTSR